MADLIGRTLGRRYRIEAGLGRGGMAEVYRAFDTRRHYPVAVKVLREDLAEDWDFVRRFQAEAESLARLAHQNIVRFYSFEQDGRTAFIVMDLVEGDTLRGRIFERQGRPMAPVEVLPILRQVAAALAYAHAEGIIHRDVKPGNIMLRPDGTALLSDFGISKAVDAATVTAAMPGTPAYMSPEQCRGGRVDARTDVYSLGVVLYEMLAGKRPFVGQLAPDTVTGGTHERVRWEQMHAQPPDPRVSNQALTRGIGQVVMQALAKDPDQRYPSVMAFLQAFEAACSPQYSPPRPYQPPPPPPPPKFVGSDDKEAANGAGGDEKNKLRALLLSLAVVAAAVVLIGLALLLGRGGVQRLAALAASAPSATPSKTLVVDVAALTGATPLLVVAAETPSQRTANDTATPTPAAVDTATPTVTPADTPTHTATSTLTPTGTATRTPTATYTATATPSRTPSPVLTFTPTPTRAPLRTPPSPTPLPVAPPPAGLPAPTLVSPTSGSAASGRTTFAWNWNGPALTENQGFEVRIWRDGQPDHYGAAAIVQGATSTVIDVWTAYGVQQGGSGSYYWTVAVVEISPYSRTGPEATPWTLQIGAAGNDGGGGSSPPAPPPAAPTPPPAPPTPTPPRP